MRNLSYLIFCIFLLLPLTVGAQPLGDHLAGDWVTSDGMLFSLAPSAEDSLTMASEDGRYITVGLSVTDSGKIMLDLTELGPGITGIFDPDMQVITVYQNNESKDRMVRASP